MGQTVLVYLGQAQERLIGEYRITTYPGGLYIYPDEAQWQIFYSHAPEVLDYPTLEDTIKAAEAIIETFDKPEAT
jgi:hypothetical protein